MFWLLVRVVAVMGITPGGSEELPRDDASYEEPDDLECGALLHRAPPRESPHETITLRVKPSCADEVRGTFPLIMVNPIIRCEGVYDGAPFVDYRILVTPSWRRSLSFYAPRAPREGAQGAVFVRMRLFIPIFSRRDLPNRDPTEPRFGGSGRGDRVFVFLVTLRGEVEGAGKDAQR
jgi:hypothetical protein